MNNQPTNHLNHRFTDSPKTILEWLTIVADARKETIAIADTDGRSALTYQNLLLQIQSVVKQLHAIGLGAKDTIIIALENGSDFLVTILSVAATATAFPLNPNQPRAELERYFSLLDAKAVIVAQNSTSAVIEVANQASIPIVELITNPTSVGQFNLSKANAAIPVANTQPPKTPQLEDIAILVGTSGATGFPKVISLTHESFFVSIDHAANWMQLNQSDRSLVLTPLAMLHALVRSSCPLLLRGGQVVCTPGYNPECILNWLDRYQPTFFTAVPSIYRSILQAIEKTYWTAEKSLLRFLVTGSDKIDASEIETVESVFNVPLIQFYGMSEVSPLPATRSLPPEITPKEAIGKVNPLWEIACLDEAGNVLASGEEGQIVLRGAYINQVIGMTHESNLPSDWFHTGDLGYVDKDGFLYFTGRVDSRINRAGKKVYPQEVEEVLLTHPEIEAATVFGITDRLYGECIGAVIVLRDRNSATSVSVQQYMAERVADFKIPNLILIEDALVLNSFGKVKRKGLAAHYNLKDISDSQKSTSMDARTNNAVSYTAVEESLAEIWCELFEVDSINLDDDFFTMGGHSLLAIKMLFRIEETFSVKLSLDCLFDSPVLAELASEISQQIAKTKVST